VLADLVDLDERGDGAVLDSSGRAQLVVPAT